MATAAVKMVWRTEPGSRAVLEIEIPEEDVAQAMERAYAALVKRVAVPGFRRGKAPRAVLERHLGPDALREEALKDLLPERYAQAVVQAGISPVSRPSFDVAPEPQSKGLRLTATVDVEPRVVLPDFGSISVTRAARAVTEADVDRVLEDIRVRHGRLVSAESEAARRGDYVLLRVGALPALEGNKPAGWERLQPGKELLVEVGGGLLPPEVESALEGAHAGETRTAKPAGAAGPVEVHVGDVRRKELPPLDDAFARTVSEEQTLASLRERVRERVARERTDAAERDLRERVLDAVLSQVTIDLPESMVGHEMEHTLHDLESRLRSRGLSLETYLRGQGKGEAGLRADLRPGAERRVRTRLVLDAVARREELIISEEEMTRAVENLSQESGEAVEKTQAWLAQGDRLEALREHLLRQKAMVVLVARAAGPAGAGEAAATPDRGPTPANSGAPASPPGADAPSAQG